MVAQGRQQKPQVCLQQGVTNPHVSFVTQGSVMLLSGVRSYYLWPLLSLILVRTESLQPHSHRHRLGFVTVVPAERSFAPGRRTAEREGGDVKTGEEARRKRIMDMQREITEDILLVSEAEREAAKAKSLKERSAARKAIYQAYANVGSQESLSINQIGVPKVPKKYSKTSRTAYADEEGKIIDRGTPFAERKARLLFDSLWISSLGLAMVWAFGSYQASISYMLGASLGFGYVTLLGRFVESLGKGGPGSGVGSARFAMVILLVLFAGKYRDTIQVIPSVIGFFTYQVASFLQAFDPPKEPEDEE